MMTHTLPYVLVFCMRLQSGCAPTTAEFDSLQSCVTAQVQINWVVRRTSSMANDFTFCVRKDMR